MSDVLSQNEIDDLLSDMTSGRVDVDEVSSSSSEGHTTSKSGKKLKSSDIVSYDFRRPNRISKNQVRTFQTVHENFAEVFGYYLVSKLQTPVSISVTSVDQLFYSEFILSVSNPSCLYVFDIGGTDGNGIMEISPQFALTIVETLLGGAAETTPKSRSITAIEQAVIRGIIEHAFADLKGAWRAISEIDFKFTRLETEADFVQIAPSSEIVIVVSFDVNLGTHQFLMNLCFPTFALEEVLAQLNRQQVTSSLLNISKKKQQQNMENIKKRIQNSYMDIVAKLGDTTLSVKELMEIEEGDVIKLHKRINEEIEILVAGSRKLAGRPGSIEGRKAVRVIRPLKEEDLIDVDISYKENEG